MTIFALPFLFLKYNTLIFAEALCNLIYPLGISWLFFLLWQSDGSHNKVLEKNTILIINKISFVENLYILEVKIKFRLEFLTKVDSQFPFFSSPNSSIIRVRRKKKLRFNLG